MAAALAAPLMSCSGIAQTTGTAQTAPATAQTPGASLMPADQGASAAKHFDQLGQPPSKFSFELRNGVKARLPFSDKRDFDEAKLQAAMNAAKR